MFDTWEEALAYLDAARGMSLGLDGVRGLLARLGDPQRSLRFVHVTGTNGKGSVAVYTAAALSACGCRTGRFMSPAVADWRETIAVDGVWISPGDAARCVGRAAAAAEQARREGETPPTRFELETAAALLYFAERNCAIVVLEAGLGGRLDATNAVEETLVAAFTPVALDHAAQLGGTLAAVAGEKAGILKPGCTAVAAPQPEAALAALTARAGELGCPLTSIEAAEAVASRPGGQTLRVGGEEYFTRMAGLHQAVNLALALAVLDALRARGWKLPVEQVKKGIAQAFLPGRYERLSDAPVFMLDGAHNPAAAAVLAENLARERPRARTILILGIFRDKDIDGILDALLPVADEVLTFDWAHPRRADGLWLAQRIASRGRPARYAGTAAAAVRQALDDARTNDRIAGCGSLSHLTALRQAYTEVKHG